MKETKKERFIQAWKSVFDVDDVKDDDNFFEVGGDSMKGVQLISILAGYGLKLDMLKLYTQPTVEELVEAAEEMEPVEIPAEVISGSLSGEEIEKYLADPAIQKAMNEFGIRPEDILEKIGAEAKASEKEVPKAATGPEAKASEKEAPKAAAGAEPKAAPFFAGGQPGALPPFTGMQPGVIPVKGGYLVPVPVMYYFVPASGSEGLSPQPPASASFPGSSPFPVMAYPVYPQWPYGAGNLPEGTSPDKKEI